MQRMKRVSWIAVVAMLSGGCVSHKDQDAFARRPEFKSVKTTSGSGRKEKAPVEPRILPDTYYAAGRVFEQQGAPDRAIEQYRKAIAVNHEYTAAYARLGLMLSLTGQHEESVEAFAQAVELKPGSAVLRNNLGFELLYLERWDEAERHLREAARLDSKLTQAHINLGLLLGRTQRPELAFDSFRKVLPEPDAYYNLGLLQRAQGEYANAAASFRRVLAINPKFTAAQKQLVQVERRIAENGTASNRTPAPAPEVIVDGTTNTPSIVAENAPIFPAAANTVPPVDLTTLITEMVIEPKAPESNKPQANTTTHQSTITAIVPVVEAQRNEPIEAQDQNQNQNQDQIQNQYRNTETTGTTLEPQTIEAIKPVEVIEKTDTNREEPAAQMQLVKSEDAVVVQSQPVRWDLTLDDMARVLNIADSQHRGLEDIQTIAAQSAPMSVQPEAPDDVFVGPPSVEPQNVEPQNVEVVMVLGTSETRTEPQEAKAVTTITVPNTEGQQTMRALDDMEVSLQIIRNEIECQKEFGTGNAETAIPRPIGDVQPVHYAPVQPVVDPNQRTQLWDADFQRLDSLLSVARNDTDCANDNPFAQNQTDATVREDVKESFASFQENGPAVFAAPATTSRRVRWTGKGDQENP